MTDQHPISPPLELVRQWTSEAEKEHQPTVSYSLVSLFAAKAARWGADQELEACCDWLDRNNQWARCDIDELHDARRPKPQSLKEQALAWCNDYIDPDGVIRRALEQLDD